MLVRLPITILAAALFAVMTPETYSAVLSAPALVAAPGSAAIAPISLLSEGQTISGIQLDLDWDDACAVRVIVGDKLRQSSRVLYAASLQPRGVRYLIVGMDSGALSDGELLKAFIAVGSGAAPGIARIRVTNVIATDVDGHEIPVRSSPVTIDVQPGETPAPLLAQGVLNAASLLPGAISPGTVTTLLGYFPSSEPALLFNGIRAPLLYAGAGQVNAVVPFELAVGPPATLQVLGDGQPKIDLQLPTAAVTPAIFTQGGTGIGPGAALNQNYSINSPANPAEAGSVLMVYGTGFGSLDPPAPDSSLTNTSLPVTASLSGIPAEVLFAGSAPWLVPGVTQVNLRIPRGIVPNPAAPLLLTIGSVTTPPGVTVSVR